MKQYGKLKRTVVLAGVGALCLSFQAMAGQLVKDGSGVWYQNDDGSYIQNDWHQEENGDWYYFGEDGYAEKGIVQGAFARYMMAPNGVMYTNCTVYADGKYYDADQYGILMPSKQTEGWVVSETGWLYRLDRNQIAKDQWIEKDGAWFYLGGDGFSVTGWRQIGDAWYYFSPETYAMQTGWLTTPDGAKYYLGDAGKMQTGWQTIGEGKTYYFDGEGKLLTGWQTIGEDTYYLDENGVRQTGWQDFEGGRRYLNAEGKLLKNTEQAVDGVTYTFDANGMAAQKVVYVAPTNTSVTSASAPADTAALQTQVNQMADQVLARITNSSMSKTQKARAIYSWVRGNMRYVNHSEKGNWVKSAYDGFRTKRGDCYTYYSVSLALLSRADIPSIEVIRTDGHHWWNLVNCGNGWYHFDTTPRAAGGTFCLLTDAELERYSSTRGRGSHRFDHSKYPATPTTPSP